MRTYPHTIRLRGPWQWRTREDAPRHGSMNVPGWWRDAGLDDFWGMVELRRAFHWPAAFDADEVVYLVLDRCVGRATVRLNDVPLGVHDCPWDSVRFDVTEKLRPRNELAIELEALPPAPGDAHRYGTLGCAAGDWKGANRRPVGGISGLVYLSVESRIATVTDAALRTGWDSGGRLRFTSVIETAAPTPTGAVLVELLLDGRPIHEQTVALDARRTVCGIDLDSLPVEPWLPRSLGKPSLHELSLAIFQHGRVLFERSWQIGFRSIELLDDLTLQRMTGFPARPSGNPSIKLLDDVALLGRTGFPARPSGNPSIELLDDAALCHEGRIQVRRRLCWPEETFRWSDAALTTGSQARAKGRTAERDAGAGATDADSFAFCEPETARREAAAGPTIDVVRVVGHVAPDSFYDMCDREGIAVEQDVLPGCLPPDPTVASETGASARLGWHPCLIGWRTEERP